MECCSITATCSGRKTKKEKNKKNPPVSQICTFISESFGNVNQISAKLDKVALNNLFPLVPNIGNSTVILGIVFAPYWRKLCCGVTGN